MYTNTRIVALTLLFKHNCFAGFSAADAWAVDRHALLVHPHGGCSHLRLRKVSKTDRAYDTTIRNLCVLVGRKVSGHAMVWGGTYCNVFSEIRHIRSLIPLPKPDLD